MDHSNITLPQTFALIPNCSKCQNKVRKLFSTIYGVYSIGIEDDENAGGRVIVKSRVNHNVLAVMIGEIMKEKKSSCGGSTPLVDQSLFNGEQGINMQELTKMNKMKHLELKQNLKINFGEEKVRHDESSQNGSESDNKGTPPDHESNVNGSETDNKEITVEQKSKVVTDIGNKSYEDVDVYYTPSHSFDHRSQSSQRKANNFVSGSNCRCVIL